jgi:hypothetical protein
MGSLKRYLAALRAKTRKPFIKFLILILLLGYGFAYLLATPVQASSLTTLSDNMSRIQATTLSDHTIQFITPSGVTAFGQTITLNFNSFTTVTNVTSSDVNLNVSSGTTCTGFSSRTVQGLAGSNIWGVGAATTIVTLTAPSSGTIATSGVPAGNCVQIKIGSNAGGSTRITNPSAGQATISIAGTFNDTGTIAVPIISSDQVALTATVNPTISLTLSQSALGFGTLTASSGRWATNGGGASSATTSMTAIVGTNGTSGYAVFVQGAPLTSGSNALTVQSSPTASTVASSQFGLNVAVGTAGTGTPTATSPYSTASDYAWTATATTQAQIASNTAPDSNTTFNLSYIANISSGTAAGTYAATDTYTATGNF